MCVDVCVCVDVRMLVRRLFKLVVHDDVCLYSCVYSKPLLYLVYSKPLLYSTPLIFVHEAVEENMVTVLAR